MLKSRASMAIGVLAAAAATGTAAAATSQTQLFQNPHKTVVCGIKIHPAGRQGHELLCSAKGIPRAKRGAGDPFVQIGPTGSPQLVLISQNSFAGHNLKTLSQGTLWSGAGVTCNVGSATVLCFNRDNHGFVIGNGKYRAF